MNGAEALADIAVDLMGAGHFDDRMTRVLGIAGRYLGVSRAYVFMDSQDGTTTDNTHEWCAAGVAQQKSELQGIPYTSIPSWLAMLERDGRILASSIGQLPEDVRGVLEPQGIKSILVLPLFVNNMRVGFMGFDDCAIDRGWGVEELAVLRAVVGMVSTVMEKDRNLAKLGDAEANYRQFMDTVGEYIVVADKEGRIVYANRKVRDGLGYTDDELMSMTLVEMHPADKREEAARIVQSMIDRERDTCPLELLRKNGARVPVETRVWFGEWDGRESIFGMSRDLGPEQESLQLFTRLFDDNPAPMALSGIHDGRFVHVNDAFIEKFGYSHAELVGKSSLDLNIFVHPTQRITLAREFARQGRIHNVEVQVRRKDGTVLSGLFSGSLLDNQGTRLLLTVMIDITGQIELRDRLEAQRRQLKALLASCGPEEASG